MLDFSKRRNKDNEEAHFPEYYDVSMVAYLIRLFRSKEVIEFGSGCSTAGLKRVCDACAANFYSIDSEEKWREINNKILMDIFPSTEPIVYLHQAQVEKHNDITGYVHEGIPVKKYDFIYIDGPPLESSNAAIDVVKHDMLYDQSVVMFDGRRSNVNVVCKYLKSKDSRWKRFSLKYPSNDTILVHPENLNYGTFIKLFDAILFEES